MADVDVSFSGSVGAGAQAQASYVAPATLHADLSLAGDMRAWRLALCVLSSTVGASANNDVLKITSVALFGGVGAFGGFSSTAAVEALLHALIEGWSAMPVAGDGAAIWVVNAETGASTRYENFPFNSFAKIGNDFFGCKSDGIYQLDGDDDAGDPVQAVMSFGKQDFGTTMLKRVTNIYAGTSSGGRLFVKVLVEGQSYLYEARDASGELQVQRFDLGRGLRANYLEFELYNSGGDDFELASVEFAAVPLSRRI